MFNCQVFGTKGQGYNVFFIRSQKIPFTFPPSIKNLNDTKS